MPIVGSAVMAVAFSHATEEPNPLLCSKLSRRTVNAMVCLDTKIKEEEVGGCVKVKLALKKKTQRVVSLTQQ